MTPEQKEKEAAALQELYDELIDLEKEVKKKLKEADDAMSGALSFVMPNATRKKIEISVRAGQILLDYIDALKIDLKARIDGLSK